MTRLPTGEFRAMGSRCVGVRTGNVYDQGYG